MKYLFYTIFIILLSNCSKPKTVLICGDHICINKDEAEQYFEENLTLEVKVVNKKIKNEVDLIELNLVKDSSGKKKITLSSKKDTSENLKILTNDEKLVIKKDIKKKRNEKKIAKKSIVKEKNSINPVIKKKVENSDKVEKKSIIDKGNIKNVNKNNTNIVDVCTILEKCSIDEISKFLLEQGKNKDFPDITLRQ